MKNAKKLLSAAIALPLILGSVTAVAESPMRPAPGAAMEDKRATVISAIFRGVEMSQQQVEQFKANMAKIAQMKADAVEEQIKLKQKDLAATMFEGVNITEEQQQRIMANIAELRQANKEKFVDFIKSKLASIPQTLPDWSKERPVADIPAAQ